MESRSAEWFGWACAATAAAVAAASAPPRVAKFATFSLGAAALSRILSLAASSLDERDERKKPDEPASATEKKPLAILTRAITAHDRSDPLLTAHITRLERRITKLEAQKEEESARRGQRAFSNFNDTDVADLPDYPIVSTPKSHAALCGSPRLSPHTSPHLLGSSKEKDGEESIPWDEVFFKMRGNRVQDISRGLDCQQYPCVVIADFGEDIGNEVALLILKALETIGVTALQGVITTGSDPQKSAVLVKGALDILDLKCEVGLGTQQSKDCGGSAESDLTSNLCNTAPYIKNYEETVFKDGQQLLLEILEEAANKDLIIMSLGALTDVAKLMKAHKQLFVEKVRLVAIMGGVEPFHQPWYHTPDAHTMQYDDFMDQPARVDLEPDSAYNNMLDVESASYVYDKCPKLRVPLTVMTRHAAVQCVLPHELFDEIASTNNPLALRLREAQRDSIENLWVRVQESASEPESMGRNRLDKSWFCDTFCAGHGRERDQRGKIWDLVRCLPAYGVATVVAAIPELRDYFFISGPEQELNVDGATHFVLGQHAGTSGIRSSSKLAFFLKGGIKSAIMQKRYPHPAIIITDPGQDLDDEMAMILLRHLAEKDHITPLALVATLHPAKNRARLLKGTMRKLFMENTVVCVGSDGPTSHSDKFSSTIDYLATDDELEHDTIDVLATQLRDQNPKSVLCICIGQMTDAAELVRQHEELFVDKIKSVTIMGGVEDVSASISSAGESLLRRSCSTGDGGLLVPDAAHNNMFDMDNARFFYRKVQELGVELNVLSRFTAMACPVPRSIYNTLASSGHPVALRLEKAQRMSIEGLWRRAVAPVGSAERNNLPARCDKDWFCKTFFGSLADEGLLRNAEDSIWDLVEQFNMYDPLTLCYAIPELRQRFFNPLEVEVLGTTHNIVGMSKEKHGILNAALLKQFLTNAFDNGCSLTKPKRMRGGSASSVNISGKDRVERSQNDLSTSPQ